MFCCTNSSRPKNFWKEAVLKVSKKTLEETSPVSKVTGYVPATYIHARFIHENLPYQFDFWLFHIFQVVFFVLGQYFHSTLWLLSWVCVIILVISLYLPNLLYYFIARGIVFIHGKTLHHRSRKICIALRILCGSDK